MKANLKMEELILVLGATGTIGSALVTQLLERGQRVRVAIRDLAKASRFGSTVEVVQADLEKPATLAAAFAGASKAFVLSNGSGIALETNAFVAAKAAGTQHIVRVSAQEVEFPELAGAPLGQWHIESERQLRESGVAWTVLRPSFFSSNVLVPFLFDLHEGAFLPSGGGKEAPIDPRDIAAVGVKALTSSGHENKVYVLTGPELLSYSEMTGKLAAAIGRPLKHINSFEAETRNRLLKAGVPMLFADSLLGHFAAVRAGRTYVTSTVADLLGRPARAFGEWLNDNATALQSQLQIQNGVQDTKP